MLAAVGGGGLALAAVYKLSGGRYGVPCILHATTGLDCPLCGTTRMTAALMRGDFVAAWDFNAPMLFIAPLAGILVGYQLTAWSLERARLVRLPRLRLSSRRERLLTNVLIASKILAGEDGLGEVADVPALSWLNRMKKEGAVAVLIDHDEEIQSLRASLGD